MFDIRKLASEKLDANDYRLGVPGTLADMVNAENELGLKLPDELKEFSLQVGWLEIDNCYFYGVPDPESKEGSCINMTKFAREKWGLPLNLIVIYSSEDELLWCMDSNSKSSAIFAFDVFARKNTGLVGKSLESVLIDYLSS